MLLNNFHKLILFHQIQFQLLLLTAAPNLKSNATFQIICNLQKRSTAIMDRKNFTKSESKNQKGRCSRSVSSPSRTDHGGSLVPQRTKSQLGIDNCADTNWQTFSIPNLVANPYFDAAGGTYFQQPWNPNFFLNFNRCPIPSSSNVNHQYRRTHTLPPPLNYNTDVKGDKKRRWESLSSHNKGGNKKFVFTLMSYNVLAQDLVQNHEYLYREHNKQALQWEVRWLNILKEIGDANPDIICFQEVQESHITNYFSVLEKKLGYKSIFKKRTGIRTDGCAIFYKRKRLQLMEYEKVEYFQENVPVLNRDNVAIVARFIPKEVHTQAFVVATTHLLYNPKRQDVRLAQVQNLIAEIDKMAFICSNKNGEPSYLPVIVTGDLNSTPDSAVYEFITKGILDYQNLCKRSLSKESGKELTGKVLVPESLQMTDNCQYAEMVKRRNEFHNGCGNSREDNLKISYIQDLKFSSGTLSHPFSFKSAYNHYRNNDIEGTTYQDRWITVDYIFYSGRKRGDSTAEDKLKLISRFQLPTKNQLGRIRIPNFKLGSDHFSLIVKFSLE
ncbi:protein angel homolog 2-like isoform X2 [Coccinella septempunctata]|uniref:protein angel homolog 2-like isoform X2 n=1 Tax=Coccinella septempunctata TaxID=41139 RepID=UPI001D07818C|nr:protein angel homolog 2-like isoform X2 [Coccinella septempunctata]